MSLSKNINPSLVLDQPRKTRPFITERLLMGRKESNQTNRNKASDLLEPSLLVSWVKVKKFRSPELKKFKFLNLQNAYKNK